MSNGIETVIKTLPKKKTPGSDRSIAELYQTIEELTPMVIRLFQKYKGKEYF
jgi:hypothetical protein